MSALSRYFAVMLSGAAGIAGVASVGAACSTFGAEGEATPLPDRDELDGSEPADGGKISLLPEAGLPDATCVPPDLCDTFDDDPGTTPRRGWTSNIAENGSTLGISIAAARSGQRGLRATVVKPTNTNGQSAFLGLVPLRAEWEAGLGPVFEITLRFSMRVVGPYVRLAGPRFVFKTGSTDALPVSVGLFVSETGHVAIEQINPLCGACVAPASETLETQRPWTEWHEFVLVLQGPSSGNANGTIHILVDGAEDTKGREIRFPLTNRVPELRFGVAAARSASGTLDLDDMSLSTVTLP